MIAAGMNVNDLELTISYRDGAFIGEVTLREDARLGVLHLPRGYRFRCFVSRRFETSEVVGLLRQAGWLIYETAVEPDSDHMTVVASRAEEPL